MNDKEIIQKLKSHDNGSFREFVDFNKVRVINICYRFLHDKRDSEDVAQEVFIEVFHSIRNFKGESSLNTWLYRIAVNKSLDFIKKMNRKKRLGKIISIFNIKQNEKSIIQSENNPLHIIMKNDRKKIVFNAIEKLPPNQKTALTLSKLEGFTYKEISEIMKTNESGVDSLIQRAKKNIKKILENADF